MTKGNGAMTVAELIKGLQGLPADLPVYVLDFEKYVPDIPMQADDVPMVYPPDEKHGLPRRVVIG